MKKAGSMAARMRVILPGMCRRKIRNTILIIYIFPKIFIKLVDKSSSVATKNGNNDGIIEFVQSNNPSLAAWRLDSENKTSANMKIKISVGNKNFFKDNTNIFI